MSIHQLVFSPQPDPLLQVETIPPASSGYSIYHRVIPATLQRKLFLAWFFLITQSLWPPTGKLKPWAIVAVNLALLIRPPKQASHSSRSAQSTAPHVYRATLFSTYSCSLLGHCQMVVVPAYRIPLMWWCAHEQTAWFNGHNPQAWLKGLVPETRWTLSSNQAFILGDLTMLYSSRLHFGTLQYHFGHVMFNPHRFDCLSAVLSLHPYWSCETVYVHLLVYLEIDDCNVGLCLDCSHTGPATSSESF